MAGTDVDDIIDTLADEVDALITGALTDIGELGEHTVSRVDVQRRLINELDARQELAM